MKLSNFTTPESLKEYGMSGSGAPTPVGAQGMGTTAKATNQQRKTDRAPAPSPTTSQQQQQQPADGDDTKQPAMTPAGELEKDSQFMDPEQNAFTVVSPQGQIDPEIPNDDPNTIVVQDEQGMIYALDPDTQVTVGEVEESVFDRFDKLSLEEQLNIIAQLDSNTINEAWRKKATETVEAEQDMAALLTAYGTPGKRKRKKSKKEAVGESVPNNDAEHKLRQIMSQPLLSGDIRSQMTAYIALPDPDMLLQFRLRRAEGGDEVDLRDVVKQYMEKLHPRVKARLEQE